MACGIDDPGAHRLSRLKTRRHRNITTGGRAPVTRGGTCSAVSGGVALLDPMPAFRSRFPRA